MTSTPPDRRGGAERAVAPLDPLPYAPVAHAVPVSLSPCHARGRVMPEAALAFRFPSPPQKERLDRVGALATRPLPASGARLQPVYSTPPDIDRPRRSPLRD